MLIWIIGAGGLLGSALVRASQQPYVSSNIPWSDHDAAITHLTQDLQNFKNKIVEEPHQPWSIVWAAGRTSTSSSQDEADAELTTFAAFVDLLSQNPPAGKGCFALASSAGGIYSGSEDPPFTSLTKPVPTGVYGQLKLAQEQIAQNLLSTSMSVLIARIANLYGPGQNLAKLQGFISRLAYSAISKEQVNVFVPLDTLRDYIYVDDAATLLLHWTQQCTQENEAHTGGTKTARVIIIASGEPLSLGYLINLVQDVTRTRIPIAYGSHSSANAQARDLRLIPDKDDFTTRLRLTALPAGVKTVYSDLLSRRQLAHPIANSLG